jgi:hypothetical protein
VKLRWLDRDTVRAPYMALCLTEADFLRVAKHCGINEPGRWLNEGFEACTHTWQTRSKLMCIVCLDANAADYGPIGIASLLVHEAVHAFQRLCDSIGETRPGTEFEAYAIQGIADRLMREFVRQIGKDRT